MATGLVIHISSGDDKHTEVLTGERIRIGNCEDCDLRLRASALPKRENAEALVVELVNELRRQWRIKLTCADHYLAESPVAQVHAA